MNNLSEKKMFLLSVQNKKRVDARVRQGQKFSPRYNGSHYINALIDKDHNVIPSKK